MNAHALGLVAVVSAAVSLISSGAQRPVALEAADCSRVNMMFGDEAIGRAVQHTTVPLSVGTLDIQPEPNGGVQIVRGAGAAYTITACIGAGGRTAAEAQAAADAVRISVEGGRVRVDGRGYPRSWSVQLIVDAPDNARIRVATSNGPIAVSGVSGEIDARSTNGPIALDDVSGSVVARAQNGPIRVSGSRGNVDVQTANGPISIGLVGDRWDGRLDARAENGPLQIAVSDGYQSGVEITSSDHSPWNCRIAACRSGNRDWDERSRTLRVGVDPVVVRVSTNNGPVTVQQR